jgi:hypothetical protein
MVVSSLLAIAIAIAVLGAGYYWVQWHRMTQTCQPHGSSQTVAFSWSAPGFTCTSSDGHRQAKLWW